MHSEPISSWQSGCGPRLLTVRSNALLDSMFHPVWQLAIGKCVDPLREIRIKRHTIARTDNEAHCVKRLGIFLAQKVIKQLVRSGKAIDLDDIGIDGNGDDAPL